MRELQNQKAGKSYIGQGEFAIDGGESAVITTLLGSCVATCIWDPIRQIGGMNHVLFVDETAASQDAFGYGINSMELLINGLLRLGATKTRLQAKVFGGARMIGAQSGAGEKNGRFVIEFLEREGIATAGSDLGGQLARRVEFWPGTGRARVKYVSQEVPLKTRRDSPAKTNEIELF